MAYQESTPKWWRLARIVTPTLWIRSILLLAPSYSWFLVFFERALDLPRLPRILRPPLLSEFDLPPTVSTFFFLLFFLSSPCYLFKRKPLEIFSMTRLDLTQSFRTATRRFGSGWGQQARRALSGWHSFMEMNNRLFLIPLRLHRWRWQAPKSLWLEDESGRELSEQIRKMGQMWWEGQR